MAQGQNPNQRSSTTHPAVWVSVLVLLVLHQLLSKPTVFAVGPTEKTFRAGAASIEITPPLGELVVGGFVPFPADRIHDPLYAKAIALDDGDNRIAIVVCDNLGIRREEFDAARKIIAAKNEIPVTNILMAATHTHSATRGQTDKYRSILINGIADAVHQAISNLEPAKIGWGSVNEPSEVFNRRWFVEDSTLLHNPFGGVDQVRMNPPRGHAALQKPAGPIDRKFRYSVSKRETTHSWRSWQIILFTTWRCPPGEISADYFGLFSEAITNELSGTSAHPAMVSILSNGTSGDINNINFRQRSSRRWAPYEKMQQVADLIARRVLETHQNLKHKDWVPIQSLQQEITLRARKPDATLRSYLAEVVELPDDSVRHHRYEKIYAERVAKLDAGPDAISVPLHCLQIGELAILGIPFETFAEIGLQLKQDSPFGHTFTIELANDSRGYLPTEQHTLGGYETWMGTNRVEKQASVKITKTLLKMLESLKN